MRKPKAFSPVWAAPAAIVSLAVSFGCSDRATSNGPGPSSDTGGTGGASETGGTGAGAEPGATGGTPPVAGSGGAGGDGSVSGGTAGMPVPGAGGSAGSTGGGPPDTVEPNPTLIGDVTFSVPSQTYRDALTVGMETSVAGAEVRYTTDGQLPSAASTLYAAPLSLTTTTQLRAQPFAGGVAAGRVSTALYIARTFDATSDLPIVVVDGYGTGKPEDKDVSVDAAVMVFEPAGGVASLASLPTLATRAGYHVRGQSSANFPQTPYKLEFWDNAGEDADYTTLGMPADSDWALIPPYYDRTLLRNPFVYELGREMGLQAPRTVYAEVYLNYEDRALSEADYQGIYWFSETIKNNSVRTDLKQLREDDTALPEISGGYIFKFDQAAAEEPLLPCTGAEPIRGGLGGGGGGMGGTCWIDLEVVDPKLPNAEQMAWLGQYIQTFHDLLHVTPIGDYAASIDVPSFVDNLIINELTRNVDAYVRSSYYHKDRDGKLIAGPLWDYNFSLAVGGSTTIDPEGGWQFEGSRNVNSWYPKLTSDPAFMALVSARWQELRQGLYSTEALDQRISALAAPLQNAIARDYAKWPVATVYSGSGIVRGPTVATWEAQVQALRDYVNARLAWMDSQLE